MGWFGLFYLGKGGIENEKNSGFFNNYLIRLKTSMTQKVQDIDDP